MHWLPPRILALVLAMLGGLAAGALIGRSFEVPLIGAVLGAGAAISAVAVIDGLRGYRLIEWLRSGQGLAHPRGSGFWEEFGYRVERAIRARDDAVAQERLRLAQFLSAIEASPNGVLMLDAGEQIEWCNSVAADHFGLDPQRDRRQRITNLVRAPAFVAYLQGEGSDQPVTFSNPRGDGTLSVLVRNYGEGMKLVLSQDITDRERTDAMRRDFVANVSHELRTPLTVLSGFIETMGNLPLTDAERKRVMQLMTQQAQRMHLLLGDLLTLAHLEGSPRPPADRWVALGPLLLQVEADARVLSAGRHALTVDRPDGVQLAGTQSELLSAITNLVNNAVRYTPEGGRIDVGWRLLPDGSGEVSVADTGPGIAREHLPRLTERFYRVDSSRARDTGGTGLGLAIVKHVAQRHGGELEIHSEVGKGSEFRLILPAVRVRDPVPALPNESAEATLP